MEKNNDIYIAEAPDTLLGNAWVGVSERGLIAIKFQCDRESFIQYVLKLTASSGICILYDEDKTAHARVQIREYLEGKRRDFELPIDWSVMTPFQAQALRITITIPFGQTLTYGEIAAQLGNLKAARAVGRAQATNPMPLVIPCHRVLGAHGELRGYGAANGIQTKAWLLKLEHAR